MSQLSCCDQLPNDASRKAVGWPTFVDPGPVPNVVSIWKVNQWMKDLCVCLFLFVSLSPSLFLSPFLSDGQINILKDCISHYKPINKNV